MIIECPECGIKNSTSDSPLPSGKYNCGNCGAVITVLQTVDTPTEETDSSVTSGTGDKEAGKNVAEKINRLKDYTISGLLIILSIVINFRNYIYVQGNPYPDLPGAPVRLWVMNFPEVGIAAIIAVFFFIPKRHKHVYLYYFAILFVIVSTCSIMISIIGIMPN